MANESSPPTSSSVALADGSGLTAVLAHSMLGTASTIGSAIALAREERSSAANRDNLLALAMSRLDFLVGQLRDLTAGMPNDLVPTVNPGRRHGDSGTRAPTEP
jgi:hypothetical protein